MGRSRGARTGISRAALAAAGAAALLLACGQPPAASRSAQAPRSRAAAVEPADGGTEHPTGDCSACHSL